MLSIFIDVPDLLFGTLRMIYKRYKPFPPVKKSIIYEIYYMRNMFIKAVKKINLKRHKAIRIPDRTLKM